MNALTHRSMEGKPGTGGAPRALFGRHLRHELLQREEKAKHQLLVLSDVGGRQGPVPLTVVEADTLLAEYLPRRRGA